MHTDRFPSKPYIVEGNPKNITAVVNETVIFNCPVVADIAVHYQWAKYHENNDTDVTKLRSKSNITKLEVLYCYVIVYVYVGRLWDLTFSGYWASTLLVFRMISGVGSLFIFDSSRGTLFNLEKI